MVVLTSFTYIIACELQVKYRSLIGFRFGQDVFLDDLVYLVLLMSGSMTKFAPPFEMLLDHAVNVVTSGSFHFPWAISK